jgi:integrase
MKGQLTKRLTPASIEALQKPDKHMVIYWDDEVPGFGVRVTRAGTRSFVFRYRTKTRIDRLYTIGKHPYWNGIAARTEAKRIRKEVDQGRDPVGDFQELRDAYDVTQLADLYIERHLPRKRVKGQKDDRSMIMLEILPAIGDKKVHDVTFADIDAIHRKITKRGKPYRANRTVALLSKMFAYAIRWEMRSDNPVKYVERNTETPRVRYIRPEETFKLLAALRTHPDQQEANVVRLLFLTGARLGEVLKMRWDDLSLDGGPMAGTWTKPSHHTKQKRTHFLPLSPDAWELLSKIKRNGNEYVFPSHTGKPRNDNFKKPWRAICAEAGISGLRIHDLRHSFAAYVANGGAYTLQQIGALLGRDRALCRGARW